MGKFSICLVPFLLLWIGCAGLGLKGERGVAPAAKSILIYSSGGSVISGTLDPATVGTTRLRLPATARGINLYQNGESLKWFTFQLSTRAQEREAPASEKYQLIGLPPLGKDIVKFDYALSEIGWAPQLSASILDGKTLGLRLQAAITMGANQIYEKCDVTLILNNAVSVQSLSGHTFRLNSFDLHPFRNVVYSLDNRTIDYSFVRVWNTYGGQDNVFVKIRAKNPFSINLSQTRYTVDFKQINIDYGTLESSARPGGILTLDAGVDSTIKTFRSIKITESRDNKMLRFNHRIGYTVTNTSDEEKTLHLVAQRVMGNEHRSVYHYRTPPDATPENTLVWILKLPPHGTRTLEYDYDADVKDVPGESGFEQGG